MNPKQIASFNLVNLVNLIAFFAVACGGSITIEPEPVQQLPPQQPIQPQPGPSYEELCSHEEARCKMYTRCVQQGKDPSSSSSDTQCDFDDNPCSEFEAQCSDYAQHHPPTDGPYQSLRQMECDVKKSYCKTLEDQRTYQGKENRCKPVWGRCVPIPPEEDPCLYVEKYCTEAQ